MANAGTSAVTTTPTAIFQGGEVGFADGAGARGFSITNTGGSVVNVNVSGIHAAAESYPLDPGEVQNFFAPSNSRIRAVTVSTAAGSSTVKFTVTGK